jgi:hypothetical protein
MKRKVREKRKAKMRTGKLELCIVSCVTAKCRDWSYVVSRHTTRHMTKTITTSTSTPTQGKARQGKTKKNAARMQIQEKTTPPEKKRRKYTDQHQHNNTTLHEGHHNTIRIQITMTRQHHKTRKKPTQHNTNANHQDKTTLQDQDQD